MKLYLFLLRFYLLREARAFLNFTYYEKFSDVTIGLAEAVKGLNPSTLAILIESTHYCEEIDNFIHLIHQYYYKSVIFCDVEQHFKFIENNIRGSTESYSLIFGKPHELTKMIYKRKLAHRLNLFIFYWGAKHPPRKSEVIFDEPMRAVVITRPRERAFRIYYSHAKPTEKGSLRLVNWFDAESLGLYHTPLLPSLVDVYSNLSGRVLRVPVFHSPPWFWVDYGNETNMDWDYDMDIDVDASLNYNEINVTGGRDHRLLTLLASCMHFKFVYIDTPGRTQGSLRTDDENNISFTGGIGLLQEQKAHLLLGDVSLSWERRKVVEFSFFTLADSGAFVTHAPRRLNEALAVLRPFKKDVWPYLVLTLAVSGPMLYVIIVIPFKFSFQKNKLNGMIFYSNYLNEITPVSRVKKVSGNYNVNDIDRDSRIPDNLLDRCIWFTVQLFLKQSCSELYDGYRAKFLMIVFWISATYVLADGYSAQLTSQFARPAREQPINNLQKLQKAILHNGYRLYVEKDSSSLEMLQNGTEIFQNLYALMRQQTDYEGYVIDSVQSGIKLIADGLENKVVLGGRETLYFNMKQFGSKTFQLSHKLYSRYSAVAVQIGCPFLDSLNRILIRLFEGGIMDKITNAEYEELTPLVTLNKDSFDQQKEDNSNTETDKDNKKINENSDYTIQPINLVMLQGAFIALVFGYTFASLILVLELFLGKRENTLIHMRYKPVNWNRIRLMIYYRRSWKKNYSTLLRLTRLYNKN